MSTIRGLRIARAEVHVPRSGGWLADITLETGAVPAPGPATLQLADLALVGAILPDRGGLDGPDQPRVVAAGGAGWETLLPPPGGRYESAGNVRLSTVLRDLAELAGEAYDAPAEAKLPPLYEWTESSSTAPVRARDVLADLVARGAIATWRVAPSGRTRFDAWPAIGAADTACRVISRNLARGRREIGLDTRAAALLPGATLEGAAIARVIFHETGAALTAEVWTS